MKLRSGHELSATLADVREEQISDPDSGYYNGIAAALEWVTGQRHNGPVSVDTMMAPEADNLHSELRAAIDMLHAIVPMGPGVNRAYLAGAEGTLAWVMNQTDENPF